MPSQQAHLILRRESTCLANGIRDDCTRTHPLPTRQGRYLRVLICFKVSRVPTRISVAREAAVRVVTAEVATASSVPTGI